MQSHNQKTSLIDKDLEGTALSQVFPMWVIEFYF